MKHKAESRRERSVEVVAGPRNPVRAVKDVGVSVVPCPPQQFDAHDVKGYIQQYGQQSHYKRKIECASNRQNITRMHNRQTKLQASMLTVLHITIIYKFMYHLQTAHTISSNAIWPQWHRPHNRS